MTGTMVVGMPGKEWTTPKQKQFLQDELLQYSSMSAKEYTQHCPAFLKQWSQCWPKTAVAFPDLPFDTLLTVEQEKILADAGTKHHQVSDITLTLTIHTNLHTANMTVAVVAQWGWKESVCQQEDIEHCGCVTVQLFILSNP